ncbi:MAG: hypothetical protein AAF581_18910 [Planctomycetota bacterium]
MLNKPLLSIGWCLACMVTHSALLSAQVVTEIVDMNTLGAGLLEGPEGVAVDSLGNVYVVGSVSNNLVKITPGGIASELLSHATPGIEFLLPWGVAVDDADNVYASAFGSNRVYKIEAGTPSVILDNVGTGLNGPRGVAVDASGNVFVVGHVSGNLLKVTPGGAVSEVITPNPLGPMSMTTPYGVAVDMAGNAFVACNGSDNVLKVTPGGTVSEIIDSTGAGPGFSLNGAYDVATDSMGNVFVACNGSSNVFRITPVGGITEIMGVCDGLCTGHMVTVDNFDVVYVSGNSSHNVLRRPPGGETSEVISASGDGMTNPLSGAFGVATDTQGNVYVAGKNSDNVFRIDLAPIAFQRGDLNATGNTDVGDAIVVLDYLFNGGPATCLDAMDWNNSESVTLTDAFQMLCYLFCVPNTPPPPDPFGTCGFELDLDALGCDVQPAGC